MNSTTADLSALTGVRSGKRSYYRAYKASDERLKRSVQSMDSIAQSVVRAGQGVEDLLEEVVRAAASHLEASWVVLALSEDRFPDLTVRFLALDRAGQRLYSPDQVPQGILRFLSEDGCRAIIDGRLVRAPMTLNDQEIGGLVVVHDMADEADPADLLVLRILANQAAVAIHTFQQYRDGKALERRAEQLYDEACARQHGLEQRSVELRRLEERLAIADQRELINNERRRIARELHDSVIHYVLSAGMTIEVVRGEAADSADQEELVQALATAKQLCQDAVGQLRNAIYSLHLDTDNELTSRLPDLIENLAPNHAPLLPVEVRVEGTPVSLPVDAHHQIVQAVGEALFNVARHAEATRAVITLTYRHTALTIAVDDDGIGEPASLAKLLKDRRRMPAEGTQHGLVNIEHRITELGGSVSFHRSPHNGLQVQMSLPLPLPDMASAGHLATRPEE